jgi:hypothetical protein
MPRHRSTLALLGTVAVVLAGCSGSPPPPTEPPTQPQRPAGVRRMLPKVDRTAAMQELQQIGIAYQNCVLTNGHAPRNVQELEPFYEKNAKLSERLQSGLYKIHWGTDPNTLPQGASNTVLGYVFDVPDLGGVVLLANGSVTQMTADEFSKAPKPPGK